MIKFLYFNENLIYHPNLPTFEGGNRLSEYRSVDLKDPKILSPGCLFPMEHPYQDVGDRIFAGLRDLKTGKGNQAALAR